MRILTVSGLAAAMMIPFSQAVLAASASAVPLAAHRAVYDLELEHTSDRSGITAAKGRIVYEFEGSSCEGYTTRHRIVLKMDTDELSRLQDQQMSSFEDAEGSLFRFVSKTYLDGVEDKVIEGTAKREGGDVTVTIKGEGDEAELVGTALFPTDHTRELLAKIAKGETFFELPIYDGSDEGGTAYTTTAIIGKEIEAAKHEAGGDGAPHRAWPVSIAYFEKDDASGEGLPIYRIDFTMFDDGITQDLVIDYGDFAMTGKLVELEMRKGEAACQQN